MPCRRWDGNIGPLDPADELAVELILERLGRLHQGVGIGVFRREIRDDLGVGPLVEPVVIVDSGLAVDGQLFPDFFGDGRLGRVLGKIGEGSPDGQTEAQGEDDRCSKPQWAGFFHGSLLLRRWL
jgi:hypothetical protein